MDNKRDRRKIIAAKIKLVEGEAELLGDRVDNAIHWQDRHSISKHLQSIKNLCDDIENEIAAEYGYREHQR